MNMRNATCACGDLNFKGFNFSSFSMTMARLYQLWLASSMRNIYIYLYQCSHHNTYNFIAYNNNNHNYSYLIEKQVSDKLNLLGTLATNFKGKGSVAFVNCGYVYFFIPVLLVVLI